MIATRFSKWLLLVLFIVALWLPLVVMLAGPKQEVSLAEKRKLAPIPQFRLNNIEEFAGAFEKYYNDHFGLRQPLVRAYNYIRLKIFSTSSSKWVLVGKDEWLFHGGDHVRVTRNAWPYSPAQLHRWAVILGQKHQWLESQGIKYLFLFTPNKNLMYPQQLPTYLNKVSDQSRLDQLVNQLQTNTKVPFLDLRPALAKASGTLRTYHTTDTHWNSYGGYVGYRALTDRLKPDFPKLAPLHLQTDDFETVDGPGGDLAQMLDMQSVLREQDIRPKQQVERCARNPTLGPNASNKLRFNNSFATYCNGAPYRVLMFRDSYSFELMPYLSETFGYIFYVHYSPVSLKVMQQLVREHKPDLVIEQRSSRWLRSPG